MAMEKILIVDDEVQNLAVLRQVLSDDYKLFFAKCGNSALEQIHKHRPQLVLLDIQMPDVDGYEVCRRIKADPEIADTAVIFVTGMNDTLDETRGFDAGAVDYITKPISPTVVQARVKSHLSLVDVKHLEKSYSQAIMMIGEAVHFNSSDESSDSWRMASYARVLGQQLGFSEQDASLLEQAAVMHDTGNVGIPASILCKPGPLDDSERRIMQHHCRIGHVILTKNKAPVFKWASIIALHHHERWDGQGYPSGISAEAIPLTARIVAVVDAFNAMTMDQPYRKALTHEVALQEIIDNSGSQFDPTVVDAFLQIQPEIDDIHRKWNKNLINMKISA